MVFIRCPVLVLAPALLFLSGCGTTLYSPQDPFTSIPERSSEIAVGQMDHEGVRGIVGKPLLSSMYWGFDLFRAETEQTGYDISFLPPIPVGWGKDRLYRYTLVTYDVNGRVSAVVTGIFRKPPNWRSSSPLIDDYKSLYLQAGDLFFFVNPWEREVNMLVAPTARDAFLQRQSASTGCTVILGSGDLGSGNQLTVDADLVRELPMYIFSVNVYRTGDEVDSWRQGVEQSGGGVQTPWLETLVAVNLTTGEHILEFSSTYHDGSGSLNFMCSPGQVSYLVINATANDRRLVDWQIERTETMPKLFAQRPLVLLYDGKWNAEVEP